MTNPGRSCQQQARVSEGRSTPPTSQDALFFQPSFPIIHFKLGKCIPSPGLPSPSLLGGAPFTPEALWSWSPKPLCSLSCPGQRFQGSFPNLQTKEPHTISHHHPKLQSSRSGCPQQWKQKGPSPRGIASPGVSMPAIQDWGGSRLRIFG